MPRSSIKCLAPVIGIFVGSMFGWFLHFLIRPSTAADVAVRVFMIMFGIFGWAVTAVIVGKKLHCGGTEVIDEVTRQRYRWQAPIALFLLASALTLVSTERWIAYYGCMFVLVSSFVGEVGWGRPFKIFSSIINIGP